MQIQANTIRSNVLEATGPATAKTATANMTTAKTATAKTGSTAAGAGNPQLRKAFDSFVGESFYGQMLKSMRSTLDKPAYFNGGRAEEIFTQQLDQVLSQKLSKASASQFTGPMYELFTLGRR